MEYPQNARQAEFIALADSLAGPIAARAAETAAEQAVQSLFPRAAALPMTASVERPAASVNRRTDRAILPAIGILFGILVLSNR